MAARQPDRQQVLDYASRYGDKAASFHYSLPRATIRTWRRRARQHAQRPNPQVNPPVSLPVSHVAAVLEPDVHIDDAMQNHLSCSAARFRGAPGAKTLMR
jgi:hypothetical protein